MYFAGKLVYLIVRASNKLAVISLIIYNNTEKEENINLGMTHQC